jgi:hypothetical protein
MTKTEIKYYWGVTIGLIAGFITGKVYQVWAILFYEKGHRMVDPPITGWRTGGPLWVKAVESPSLFIVVVSTIFAGLGFLFVRSFFTKDRINNSTGSEKEQM